MSKVLIIGATSAIAEATARLLAPRGDQFFLLGRDAERLAAQCADLAVRGAAGAAYGILDVNQIDAQGAALPQARTALGHLGTVLIAHATLPDQLACQQALAEQYRAPSGVQANVYLPNIGAGASHHALTASAQLQPA